MKRMLLTVAAMAAAILAARATLADPVQELNERHHFPTKEKFAKVRSSGGQNLVNHGGPVIHSAHVVPIFWGPSWGTGGADNATANHIISFFGQFGTNSHYAIITQYYDAAGSIHTSSLGNTNWFDSSAPPTNVTDAAVQGEVLKYLASHSFDASAIYEVFLPPSSYSSDGSATSCGGPNLQYCAYHGNFSNGGRDIKYSAMPYPSCGGCQSAGFTAAQNFDHFSCHETREAVTDEDLNAWYDRRGNEADDKCAWSPAPFIDGGFGYQYEWSNAAGACVK
ncbi:MAG TPA: hypothetical protein VFA79_23090 [Myxococcales bacterium]|nr:hypothetical protein [Myxococcales bacterium]